MLKILETSLEGNVPTPLDELAREGAPRMLMATLEAEVAAYVEGRRAHRGEDRSRAGATRQSWAAAAGDDRGRRGGGAGAARP